MASSPCHVVFEESGEREDYDWRMLGVFEEGRDREALLFAWKHALASPRASVSVHAWHTRDRASCSVTHVLSDQLRRNRVGSEVVEVAAVLEGGVIPEFLAAFTVCR